MEELVLDYSYCSRKLENIKDLNSQVEDTLLYTVCRTNTANNTTVFMVCADKNRNGQMFII